MNPYSLRAAFKPNHSYVCLSCLLGRPLAPSRRTLRYKATDATGVYPTPDHSVAALLWSQQEALANAAKDSGVAQNEVAQEGQTEPGNVVPPEPAVAAKTKRKTKMKVKRDGKSKVSKPSGSQAKAVKPKKTAGKSETIFSVPKPTTIKKESPVRNPPTSLMDSLRKELEEVADASRLDISKVLSNQDEHLEQTHESGLERTTGPDETVTSGPKKVGPGIKAGKRPKEASIGKRDKLAKHKKGGLAEAPAHSSGSVEKLIIRKRNSGKGNAKHSEANAAIPSRIRKLTPGGGLIRKLGGDGGVVARKLHNILDLNAEIKKTEAALERRDQVVRQAVKKGRLIQAQRRSQGASTGEKRGTKYVKFSQMDGAVSMKEALTQKSGGDIKGIVGTDIQTVNAAELDIAPIPVEQAPVPGLSYGLERVLFNPGVYHMQDPRSRVFNFDPYLQTIMPVSEFDFNALKEYITSSRDASLIELAVLHGKRYVGSSSSMTAALSHFHFLLSQWREINSSMLSRSFPDKSKSFTKLQRAPSAIMLRWKNGTYAIDADKEFDSANILMMLGKSMEKLLTLSTEDYERYRVSNSHQISSEERDAPESYHYSTMGDFLMRSQLDAHDPRLPGTGMFDLKTRAVVSIRMDAKNYEDGVGYQIKTRKGNFESFEREFFDMIRAAFLKYSLQVRMGRMDGIFVAYHNIEKIFGFQYISLPEMDATIHGRYDTSIGDQEFKLSLDLLNKILDKATKRYPEQSLRIHFETRDTQTPFMYIFAEPVTEEQVHELQTKNKEKIEEFERNILGLNKISAEDGSASKDEDKWADIRADVEEAMVKDEKSLDPKSIEKPMSSAAEDIGEREEDDTTLEQFETSNRGPLYERKASPKADHNAATATADQIEDEDEDKDEDEDEDDNVLDEDEDENAEEEEEDDDLEVQEVESEGEDDNAEVQEVEGEGEDDNAEVQEVEGEGEDDNAEVQEVEGEGEDDNAQVQEVEEEGEENVEQESGEDIEEESGVIDEEVEVVDENGDTEEMNTKASSTTNSDADSLDSVAETGDSTEANKTPESMAEETDLSEPDNLPDEAEAEAEAEAEGDVEGGDSQSPADAPFLDSIASTADASPEHDILALTLTIRNKINDAYVLRPQELGPTDAWSVEYSIAEISPQTRAWSLYQACQARRKKLLDDAAEENGEEEKLDYYMMQIKKLNQKGREWKMEQDRLDEGRPVFVVGEKGARGKRKGEGMGELEDENEGKREPEDESEGQRE